MSLAEKEIYRFGRSGLARTPTFLGNDPDHEDEENVDEVIRIIDGSRRPPSPHCWKPSEIPARRQPKSPVQIGHDQDQGTQN